MRLQDVFGSETLRVCLQPRLQLWLMLWQVLWQLLAQARTHTMLHMPHLIVNIHMCYFVIFAGITQALAAVVLPSKIPKPLLHLQELCSLLQTAAVTGQP
jgi:hypothetical protein